MLDKCGRMFKVYLGSKCEVNFMQISSLRHVCTQIRQEQIYEFIVTLLLVKI